MELSTYTLLLANFALIGILPKVFFRKDGKFTPMWFVTAAPYLFAPIVFSLQYLGLFLELTIVLPYVLSITLSVIGTLLSALSIGIIFMTMGTHRIPVALWHQKTDNDKPAYIVTWGSYRFVRHPFYCAFLLAFLACILITMNWVIMAVALYTLFVLNYTAAKEEKRLANEPEEVGESYRSYVKRTGRFIPKLTASLDVAQQHQTNTAQ